MINQTFLALLSLEIHDISATTEQDLKGHLAEFKQLGWELVLFPVPSYTRIKTVKGAKPCQLP